MTVQAAAAAMPIALAPFAADWEDPEVEDIFVVRPGEYFVRRGGVTERREAPGMDALAVEAVAVFAAHLRGQDVGENTPILDTELPGGERLNAVVYPCTPAGFPSLAIRRGSEAMPTLDALERQGVYGGLKQRIADGARPEAEGRREKAKALLAEGRITELLRHCIACRWTTVFSGETGSGKTHQTKALAMEIPLDQRIVTAANAEELGSLPHPNRLSLLYTKGGPVPMEALIEAALRNAPRWLIVPEVRGAEAFSFLWAAATGHPGITSIHAPSAQETFHTFAVNIRQHPAGARLPEEALRSMLSQFIDVVIHVERDGQGRFGVTDIAFGWEQR